jgi:hypothetical protein
MSCHLRCHYRASGEDTTRIRNEPLSLITEADCETRGCGTTQSTHTFKRTAPHLARRRDRRGAPRRHLGESQEISPP